MFLLIYQVLDYEKPYNYVRNYFLLLIILAQIFW